MTEGACEKRARSSSTDEQKKRKIYTNPTQKGGFGFSYQARTIGGNPPGFMPDQYQPGREIEKVGHELLTYDYRNDLVHRTDKTLLFTAFSSSPQYSIVGNAEDNVLTKATPPKCRCVHIALLAQTVLKT